ncbi:MAG: 16S rRNA (cytosine(1402)-N(4))-methyltransferase RsmH [Lachnospiraceae bacterium]|nr:16S rRNA (cytosine(1402)-N(4))-methyltransferase RsmH [Lachnospiraceae bacterium]
MDFRHTSVLLEKSIEMLRIRPEGTYVDGTLGGGGHAAAILERLNGSGCLIGIDQDEAAIAAASERLRAYDNVIIVRDNYRNMKNVPGIVQKGKVDGIILDLGVSSFQLDTPDRGFSYRENADAPLDMRMDRRRTLTAKDIVNTYPENELLRIIRDYGEEKYAGRIAARIVKEREKREIETTLQLAELIKDALPMKARREKGHPAKQTFQAIRIELNEELTVLEESLDDMIELLAPGGRIAVITFHSLEDRIVKNAFRRNEDPCTCPKDFPVCICGKQSKGRVITRKPITPGSGEIERNNRAKSAKLRVFEKAFEGGDSGRNKTSGKTN